MITAKLKNTDFHVNDTEIIFDDDDPLPSGFPSSKDKGKVSPHVFVLYVYASKQAGCWRIVGWVRLSANDHWVEWKNDNHF